MNIQQTPLERRRFLGGVLAAAVLVPLGGSLASCAGGGGGTTSGPSGTVSDANPFGMADNSTIDAVIFKGGYGIDYATFAGDLVQKNHAGTTAKVAASTNIAQELQPRFVGGNPPDLIDDSGANLIGINTILSQLEDLNSVVNAKNLEGKVIKDTLYPGVLAPGTFGDKLASINYVLTVFAVWYSASLFEQNGWKVPKTWDEMLALGEKAKGQGKYLFCWGKEAATYYLELAIASAIKEGGDDVRLALDNLKENCWSHPAMQSVLAGMEKIVKAGYMKPGGSGTAFTAAQAQWIHDESAVLYPSGSWIENEMKDQTLAGFKLTGAPAPTVTSGSKFPYEALHSAAAEAYIVPSQAKNVAGGKEMLRTMLSKDAATNFAKNQLASTIVKGTIPEDGFGSTALVSQTKMLDAAGKNIFTWGFVDVYGMNKDLLVVWNTFLDGKSDVATLTSDMQKITDKVRNDSSVSKVEVK
ncbi:N-acetylglucosamine/diacetylchitobiose ABC transporter substrate-binding protein [Arthrobacter sp. ISL-48]|uniref:N-acetylglucosamine/diacetylchitobiose ABC transporter substrate-binding protein n=1 Tax=Arthrobacter sp. ISL-48 TaxID=2819110 RepID=UPI001BEAF92C|nr:N-acetylglucosamine/diacetylchitobiose ABC transporter substrate-binding protein [Arthrobacter sp. ISL-48]MBT2532575.1 N-acetylglucosamine/diacetylchitobiose ABC transporter substrate-binding protein [Arthrobacter sp. ISL-48]